MAGTAFTPSSPAEVAAAANALLGDLDEVLWAAKTPKELVDTVAACEALRSHLAAVEASALAEVEDRRVARQRLGWSSTGDWFTHLAGLHHGPGRAAVRHATLLAADRSRTREALRDGLVSPNRRAPIHHTPGQVRLNPHDQRPEFRPPPRPGPHHPPPDWIRHRTRRE